MPALNLIYLHDVQQPVALYQIVELPFKLTLTQLSDFRR